MICSAPFCEVFHPPRARDPIPLLIESPLLPRLRPYVTVRVIHAGDVQVVVAGITDYPQDRPTRRQPDDYLGCRRDIKARFIGGLHCPNAAKISTMPAEHESVVDAVAFGLLDPLLYAVEVRTPRDAVGRCVGGNTRGSNAPGNREQQQKLR